MFLVCGGWRAEGCDENHLGTSKTELESKVTDRACLFDHFRASSELAEGSVPSTWGIMSNCDHRWTAGGHIMSLGQRTGDDCNLDLRGCAGGGCCSGDVLPNAAEAADGGICLTEDVSGMRVDNA